MRSAADLTLYGPTHSAAIAAWARICVLDAAEPDADSRPRTLGGQRAQGALRGSKAGGAQDASATSRAWARAALVVAVLGRHDDVGHYRPSRLGRDPEHALRVVHPGLHIAVGALPGHTARAVRGAGKAGVGALRRASLRRIRPPLRGTHALHRDGGQALGHEEALRGGRMRAVHAGLLALGHGAGAG